MTAFMPGDHVSIHRGPKGLVQHHAIVVATNPDDASMDIAEYGVYNSDGKKRLLAGHALDIVKEHGEVRLRNVALAEGWQKIDSPSTKEPDEVVNAALFLVENGAQILPQYHVTNCNGECVARWCKEGIFGSGQANSIFLSVESTIQEKVVPKVATESTDRTIRTATDKLAMAVKAVGAFAGKHHGNLEANWKATNERLDEAFATHLSVQM